MVVIRNSLLPVGRRFSAINICGLLFVKPGVRLTRRLLNHERIHTRQMLELMVIPFYLAYVAEWLWHLVMMKGDAYGAYLRISHEREAYMHENDDGYLSRRIAFGQWRRRDDRGRH